MVELGDFAYGQDIEVGTHCLVTPFMRWHEKACGEFLDKLCVVVQKNKDGLYQVALLSEPMKPNGKKVSLPKSCLRKVDYASYRWCD